MKSRPQLYSPYQHGKDAAVLGDTHATRGKRVNNFKVATEGFRITVSIFCLLFCLLPHRHYWDCMISLGRWP